MSTLLRTLAGVVAAAFAASAQASDMAASRETDRLVAALHLDNPEQLIAAPGAKSQFGQADLLRGESDDAFAGLRPNEDIIEHETVSSSAGPLVTSDPKLVEVNETRDLGKIPEPRSWAMMLLGFTVVGTALRRKPRRVPQAA